MGARRLLPSAPQSKQQGSHWRTIYLGETAAASSQEILSNPRGVWAEILSPEPPPGFGQVMGEIPLNPPTLFFFYVYFRRASGKGRWLARSAKGVKRRVRSRRSHFGLESERGGLGPAAAAASVLF